MDDYQRGRRDGIKYAVTWLAHRAASMNDPHAKVVQDYVMLEKDSTFAYFIKST